MVTPDTGEPSGTDHDPCTRGLKSLVPIQTGVTSELSDDRVDAGDLVGFENSGREIGERSE